MKYNNTPEEELKNKVAKDYFWLYDTTKIIGKIDFCVSIQQDEKELFEQVSLLWAEAEKNKVDVYLSFVQLILTIGKARTFDSYLPPPFLSVFDAEKIAFIPYHEIKDIFYLNDFNWNVAPSNHHTKEFAIVYNKVKNSLDKHSFNFIFGKDDKELKNFIRDNFQESKRGISKTRIDKNNFMIVYNKWLDAVKPSIAIDWNKVKQIGIIDGDFYLADLLSQENKTLKDKLYVLLKSDIYELSRKIDDTGLFESKKAEFKDRQKAHTQFWNKYERPPNQEYWDYVVNRRELLVPQDIRERKGSFFTPQIWVEKSQEYLADELGENWQDEYTIWDCAAGTGNLLAGLTNKYNIYASTLDKQDVAVMQDRIKNGANLLEGNVFQFDFLNDDFSKLPKSLQNIINDEEKRKKLVIYINPPYAEATTARTVTKTGTNKPKVATYNKTYEKYKTIIGKASNEVFAQFLIRIYKEIPECKIANFSKVKNLQGRNFSVFKDVFKPKLKKLFLVPAKTFDNVTGQFPIGFFIGDGGAIGQTAFKKINADVYNKDGEKIKNKKKLRSAISPSINEWVKIFDSDKENHIGLMGNPSPDFQHNSQLYISLKKGIEHFRFWKITPQNILIGTIYIAVRNSIKATWLNDRDQFLYPNDGWKKDKKFQNNYLAFTLFHGQNRISCQQGTNHWTPFTEKEVNAKARFDSNFMTDFIEGKLKNKQNDKLFEDEKPRNTPLKFSKEAKNVFEAGRELWTYYHQQKGIEINAALYDIKEDFQGRNGNGKMKHSSDDKTYSNLINQLRETLDQLAKEIEPKIYEYGFLME